MITTIYIIALFILAFLINLLIRLYIKAKNPDFPEREIQRKLSPKADIVMLLMGIIMIFGVLYINFVYQTPSEKKEIAEKIKIKEKEDVMYNNIIREKERLENRPIAEKVNELYSNLNEKGKKGTDIQVWIESFDKLESKSKGTPYENRLKKTLDSLRKISSKEYAKRESDARLKYGEEFRNLLLDRNLNIKVKVYGNENKRIKLTYVLFDDVWFRKFETMGYFDMIHDKGFTHIELSDGYDYGQGVKYEE